MYLASPKLLAQKLYEESSVQKYPLGFQIEFQDGRKFVYGKNGAAALANAGLAVTYLTTVGVHEDTVTIAHPIGTKEVTVTGTATKDQFKDGFLIVTEGTGIGEIYKIKSNTATASSVFVCTLYDGLATAWVAANTDVDVWENPFNGLVINPVDAQQAPVGISFIPMTASYYGWFQTYGFGSIMLDVNSAAGAELDEKTIFCSTNHAGQGMLSASPAETTVWQYLHTLGHIIPEADITDNTATLCMIDIHSV